MKNIDSKEKKENKNRNNIIHHKISNKIPFKVFTVKIKMNLVDQVNKLLKVIIK